jgi:uncharacterized membrane protein
VKSLGITLTYITILAILAILTFNTDLLVSLLFAIPLIWPTTALALMKNRNGWAWGAFAVLVPLISLIVVAFMRKLAPDSRPCSPELQPPG